MHYRVSLTERESGLQKSVPEVFKQETWETRNNLQLCNSRLYKQSKEQQSLPLYAETQ